MADFRRSRSRLFAMRIRKNQKRNQASIIRADYTVAISMASRMISVRLSNGKLRISKKKAKKLWRRSHLMIAVMRGDISFMRGPVLVEGVSAILGNSATAMRRVKEEDLALDDIGPAVPKFPNFDCRIRKREEYVVGLANETIVQVRPHQQTPKKDEAIRECYHHLYHPFDKHHDPDRSIARRAVVVPMTKLAIIMTEPSHGHSPCLFVLLPTVNHHLIQLRRGTIMAILHPGSGGTRHWQCIVLLRSNLQNRTIRNRVRKVYHSRSLVYGARPS